MDWNLAGLALGGAPQNDQPCLLCIEVLAKLCETSLSWRRWWYTYSNIGIIVTTNSSINVIVVAIIIICRINIIMGRRRRGGGGGVIRVRPNCQNDPFTPPTRLPDADIRIKTINFI